MDDIETYQHEGLTIRIKPDYDGGAECPREWGTTGTILTFHKQGEYGEVTTDDIDVPEQAQRHLPTDTASAIKFWTRRVKAQYGATVVLPIWHYTHSGMTIRTAPSNPFHCRWDSGLMGLIFDTPQGIRDCWGTDNPANKPPTRAGIKSALTGEVEVYNTWLSGDVYGYVIEDADGDEVDACWGFYGIDDVKEQAEEAAKCAVKYRAQEDAKVARCCAL